VIRAAIVASLTRQTRAISGVVRPQPVVGDHIAPAVEVIAERCRRRVTGRLHQQRQLAAQRRLAAQQVERAVARRDGQPRAWSFRHAAGGPRLERGQECVLDALLRQVEVAGDAHRTASVPPGAEGVSVTCRRRP
jgi:hypothetical protein